MTALMISAFHRIDWPELGLMLLYELALLLRLLAKAAVILLAVAGACLVTFLALLFTQRLPWFIRRHF